MNFIQNGGRGEGVINDMRRNRKMMMMIPGERRRMRTKPILISFLVGYLRMSVIQSKGVRELKCRKRYTVDTVDPSYLREYIVAEWEKDSLSHYRCESRKCF